MCQMVCLVLGVKLAEEENVVLLETPELRVGYMSFALQAGGTEVP